MPDSTTTTTATRPDTTGLHRATPGGLIALEIPVDRIDPDPDQPRTWFDHDALARLARSLATHGQIQPIAVRTGRERGRYMIVTGERRWRAALAAGLPAVSAVVVDGPRATAGAKRLELQLTENALREGLTPVDQARAFHALCDRNGWSARHLADVLQVHYSKVTRSLALLNLPGPLLDLVARGTLSPRTALEVARLGDSDAQAALAARVAREGLSLAETAALVRGRAAPAPPATAPGAGSVRVFETSAGRVTVETRPQGDGFDPVVTAVLEVVGALKAASAARAAGRR